MTIPIKSTELKEIEKQARAKARAEAEQELRAIRNGEYRWHDSDAPYRIRINVTLCGWGEEDSYTYQHGLDLQGGSDVPPTIKNLRDLSTPEGDYQPTSVSLCTYWYLETRDERPHRRSRWKTANEQGRDWRIANVTVWEPERE
tara:strand:+ start:1376 stop:1807 length:432 start_codon:yes stop_codon:yes gene_type:complete